MCSSSLNIINTGYYSSEKLICYTYGLPELIFSCLTSEEFEIFCKKNGVRDRSTKAKTEPLTEGSIPKLIHHGIILNANDYYVTAWLAVQFWDSITC